MVVQKVADVGGEDAGEQDADSLLMVGSSSLFDRDISDSLAPQMSLRPTGVEEGRVGRGSTSYLCTIPTLFAVLRCRSAAGDG
jgi:hypothetical protein